MTRTHPRSRPWPPVVIFLAAFILAPATIRASESPPEDTVASIRELYGRTNEAIRQAVANASPESRVLYCNEVILNRYDGPWRAVGNYSRRETYWYSDQPEFARYDGRTGESVLVKVEIRETSAALTVSEEYLFDQGKLVFHYRRDKAGDRVPREERMYFQERKMIRRLGDPKSDEHEPGEPAKVLAAASGLQRFFLSFFE